MILRFLFFVFLFYVLFKLVRDFVIPIYKTTKRVKQSFRDMNQQMQEQQSNVPFEPSRNVSAKPNQTPMGDYIDFEEVKD